MTPGTLVTPLNTCCVYKTPDRHKIDGVNEAFYSQVGLVIAQVHARALVLFSDAYITYKGQHVHVSGLMGWVNPDTLMRL